MIITVAETIRQRGSHLELLWSVSITSLERLNWINVHTKKQSTIWSMHENKNYFWICVCTCLCMCVFYLDLFEHQVPMMETKDLRVLKSQLKYFTFRSPHINYKFVLLKKTWGVSKEELYCFWNYKYNLHLGKNKFVDTELGSKIKLKNIHRGRSWI